MPNYRRSRIAGGTYFFTVVTFARMPWLCENWARRALRAAIEKTRQRWPFRIDAWVLLPDHLHCIWTLPKDDDNYSVRWRLIKQRVSRDVANRLEENAVSGLSASRVRRGEREVWQRRFWEHEIRDAGDFANHCDYIHYNPVKHGLCADPAQWPYSTYARFVREGKYPAGWGVTQPIVVDGDTGHE